MIVESSKAGKVSSMSKKNLQTAILVDENDIKKVNDFYEREVEIHGNESNLICCLKVICTGCSTSKCNNLNPIYMCSDSLFFYDCPDVPKGIAFMLLQPVLMKCYCCALY